MLGIDYVDYVLDKWLIHCPQDGSYLEYIPDAKTVCDLTLTWVGAALSWVSQSAWLQFWNIAPKWETNMALVENQASRVPHLLTHQYTYLNHNTLAWIKTLCKSSRYYHTCHTQSSHGLICNSLEWSLLIECSYLRQNLLCCPFLAELDLSPNPILRRKRQGSSLQMINFSSLLNLRRKKPKPKTEQTLPQDKCYGSEMTLSLTKPTKTTKELDHYFHRGFSQGQISAIGVKCIYPLN